MFLMVIQTVLFLSFQKTASLIAFDVNFFLMITKKPHVLKCTTLKTIYSKIYIKKCLKASNCEVVAVSVDSEFSHLNWTNTPRFIPPSSSFLIISTLFRSQGGVGRVKIPLLADKGGNIAKSFGCFNMSEGVAFRGLYIVDNKMKIRHVRYEENILLLYYHGLIK